MDQITVTVYKTRRPIGRQRWRVRVSAANGRILAHSEAYTNLNDARHCAQLLASGNARIVVEK